MSEALNQQYHELLGWKRTDRPLVSASDWYPGFAGEEFWRVPGGGEIRDRLPNLHEDADLCIAELDRVFRNDWIVDRTAHGFRLASCKSREDISESGANFNEAALKCLIAAHKRDGGEK